MAETEQWMLDDMNGVSTCLDKISLQTISEEDPKTVEDRLRVYTAAFAALCVLVFCCCFAVMSDMAPLRH